MWYGWAGATLEVDLSRGRIEKEAADRSLLETLLGGKGVNAKILWDRVPPEVDAYSPDNLLIVGTGVLTGTMVPSANRTVITFKSPVLGIKYYCTVGGFFGGKLKAAGYDTIVFSGKSPTPVYLWINDDKVELRDASYLWGKGNEETRRLIQEELEIDDIEILSIGMAGENRIGAASIEGSYSVSASRGGGGAVMGDKKLKAIAVHGTKDINVFNGSRLFELSGPILERSIIKREMQWKEMWLGAGLVSGNPGAVGHFSGDVSAEVKQKVKEYAKMTKAYYKGVKTRDVACFNCSTPCKRVIPFEGYHVAGKCQWNTAGVINSQVMDPDYGTKFYALCQKHGFDDISLSQYIGFAIDLFRRGILTKEDTDGMELAWGNAEVVYKLIDKIAQREGFGGVLADGLYLAAQRIGRGAENYTYHTKKLEPLPFDVRGLPHRALPIATIDKADRTRGLSGTYGIWERPMEEREAYINAGFFQYPEEFKKYFLGEFDPSGRDYEAMIQFMSYNEEILALTDAAGFCFFWTNFGVFPPVNNRPLMADLISAATGMDIDEAGLTEIAQRIGHLVRAYNVREGIRRKDDDMADSFYEKSDKPPYRQIERDLFNKWLDRYYELKGWDKEGIPTGDSLHKIGLDYVRQDLEQRGILALPPVPVSSR
ncbi:MAG: aldehyde dehydrogenase [Chloroflexi bacterium]|nr:aldehyde dehydrogenase [Chloroflexota bacterium]